MTDTAELIRRIRERRMALSLSVREACALSDGIHEGTWHNAEKIRYRVQAEMISRMAAAVGLRLDLVAPWQEGALTLTQDEMGLLLHVVREVSRRNPDSPAALGEVIGKLSRHE